MEIKQATELKPIQLNPAKTKCSFKARMPVKQVQDVFEKFCVPEKPSFYFQDKIKNVFKGLILPFRRDCKRVDFSVFKKTDYSITLEGGGKEYLSGRDLSDILFLNGNGKKLLKILEKSKNLTLDSPLPVKNYDKEETFDFPIKFAIASLNTFRQKGNAHIVEKVPKLFEGLNQKILFEKMDKMLDALVCYKTNVFQIDGRYFTAEFVDFGGYGGVYKIRDINKKCPPVALKLFHNPYKVSSQGIFNEIGLYRELNRQKVNDIPDFYMANPIGNYYKSHSEGGWMITDFIEETKPIKKFNDGMSLTSFMKKHSLKHFDDNAGTRIGVYAVDLGGIQAKDFSKDALVDKFSGPRDLEMILKGLRKGETVQDIIDALTKRLYGEKV